MLWQLFITFFKIGAFTFGSGYAMIPIIEAEVVDKKGWFDKDEFMNQFVLAQSAPGPFALNTAVFVGYKMKGVAGAVASVLGVVLPSFTILLLIAMYLSGFRTNPYVAAALQGMRPAVVALIAVPFVNFLQRMKWWQVAISIAVALVIWLLGVSPVYFIFGGRIVGVFWALYRK